MADHLDDHKKTVSVQNEDKDQTLNSEELQTKSGGSDHCDDENREEGASSQTVLNTQTEEQSDMSNTEPDQRGGFEEKSKSTDESTDNQHVDTDPALNSEDLQTTSGGPDKCDDENREEGASSQTVLNTQTEEQSDMSNTEPDQRGGFEEKSKSTDESTDSQSEAEAGSEPSSTETSRRQVSETDVSMINKPGLQKDLNNDTDPALNSEERQTKSGGSDHSDDENREEGASSQTVLNTQTEKQSDMSNTEPDQRGGFEEKSKSTDESTDTQHVDTDPTLNSEDQQTTSGGSDNCDDENREEGASSQTVLNTQNQTEKQSDMSNTEPDQRGGFEEKSKSTDESTDSQSEAEAGSEPSSSTETSRRQVSETDVSVINKPGLQKHLNNDTDPTLNSEERQTTSGGSDHSDDENREEGASSQTVLNTQIEKQSDMSNTDPDQRGGFEEKSKSTDESTDSQSEAEAGSEPSSSTETSRRQVSETDVSMINKPGLQKDLNNDESSHAIRSTAHARKMENEEQSKTTEDKKEAKSKPGPAEDKSDNYDTKKLDQLLTKLNLQGKFQQKIKTADVLQIIKPCTENDMVILFLQRLLMMNYRARSSTESSKINKMCALSGTENEGENDVFAELFERSFEAEVQSSFVHSMDVQMAVLHCSDNFLKQMIVTKLSQCQYALPLLVPNSFTGEIEFPLWTFRQIRKSWKTSDTSNNIICKEMNIVNVDTPMVAFFRLGAVSTSKSQLMNSLINEKHDTLFHRNCPGSSRDRLLMDGVVEIAWYLPSGKSSDHFTNCVAFCNLHGDAGSNEQQLDILTEMSSVNVVLLGNLDKNDKRSTKLQNLYNGPKPIICLLSDKSAPAKMMKEGKYSIGLKDRNQYEVSEKLKNVIRELISKPLNTFRLDNVAKCSGIQVDEELEDCKKARDAAEQIKCLLEKDSDPVRIKESFFPCQGRLWKNWCQKNKELHRPQDSISEIKKSRKLQEMKQIREQQRACGLSPVMRLFTENLNSQTVDQKCFYLKWINIFLENYTLNLSSLHNDYEKKWSLILKLKENHDKSGQLKNEQTNLEDISQKLNAAALGLEHFLREIGQIYESHISVQNKMETKTQINVSSLPKLAAELMISGHPMELMDGDVAHVPLMWISAVLDELINKLGDQRVFVLSVLGIQSSGKSTMLNAMFGLQFAVSAGRCTRGAFMQLIKVSEEMKKELKTDYILVVDTEGLRSMELAGKDTIRHDNELATFVVGLGHMTLINIFGENPVEMQDILQIVVRVFMRMKKVKLNPSCMFVHQNVGDVAAGQKTMEGRRRLLETLDKMTQLAAEDEDYDAECFNQVIAFDVQTDVKYFSQLWEGSPPMAPPNPNYSDCVQDLKEAVLKKASYSARKAFKLSEFKTSIKDLWDALLHENFVVSFRNTLEIAVYRKLEAEFSKLTWNLRSTMLGIEDKLLNRIANGDLQVGEKDLVENIKTTKEEVTKSLKKYFEEDKDKDILIKWQKKFTYKIEELYDELVKAAKKKVGEAVKRKNTKIILDKKGAEDENLLMNMCRNLALSHKKTDEHALKSIFDNAWKKWITELTLNTTKKYLENQKEQYYNVFRNFCKGTTTTVILGDLICSKLEPSLLQAVYNQTVLSVTADVKNSSPAFSSNRSNLEKHILKYLAEEENFEMYMKYIHNPKQYFRTFIADQTAKYINRENKKVRTIFSGILEDKIRRISNAVHVVIDEVKKSNGNARTWLKCFSESLKNELNMAEISSVDDKWLMEIDLDFFSDILNKGLTNMMSKLHTSDINMEMLQNKSAETLIEHLCECCWVQCPFCKAICTSTLKDHEGDHSVPFHRASGNSGMYYSGTNDLCSTFCTTAVQSDEGFYLTSDSDKSVPFKQYRTAGGRYATWSITPDSSGAPYWKWFICKFQKNLEDHYDKKFQGYGEIPEEWKIYTKEDAIESLSDYI